MTRANITIAILAILILVLCVLSFIGAPLITGRNEPAIGTFIRELDKTNNGHKLLEHYLTKVNTLIKYRIGPYKNLKPEEQEKISTLMAGHLFVAVIALAGFLASAALFVINSRDQQPPVSRRKLAVTVAMVILAGTAIRLMMAAAIYGNFDMQSYETVADIVRHGGNVYAMTPRYNYSPVWFTILSVLKQIQIALPGVPFHFVVRSFLCGIDLLTLGVLLLIAGVRNLPAVRTAIFFYLSPVSFLMTGYHGQFENLAMLMVLIGIFLYFRLATRPVLKTALLWLFATAGMIVKHNTFYELIICLHSSIKRYWIKIPLFAISVIIFLSLFIPYWEMGKRGIINNVFLYGSDSGAYGITSLFALPELRYLFIPALFIFPLFLKGRDIIAQCLLGTLFFLTFTTGIAIQYFVLPVAIGVLRPSRWFLLYTLLASFLFLGNDNNNVYIPGFHLCRFNLVWVAVACWFIAEMRLDRQAAGSTIPGKAEGHKGPPIKTRADSFRRGR
jgi:hypothetical protein